MNSSPKRNRGRPKKGEENTKSILITDYRKAQATHDWMVQTHLLAQNLLKSLSDNSFDSQSKFLQDVIRNRDFSTQLALIVYELMNEIEKNLGTYKPPAPQHRRTKPRKGRTQ